MGLAQFRRRFQVLDPLLLKKLDSTSERLDERKVREFGSQAGEARCSCVTAVLHGLFKDSWSRDIRAGFEDSGEQPVI